MMLLTTSLPTDVTILLGLLLCLLYIYIARSHQYWQKKGVHTPKIVPIVGHVLDVVLFRTSLADWIKRYYDDTRERYLGLYIFEEPIFVPRDAKLIKNILIKDSNHFMDRFIGHAEHDDVQSSILFFQRSPDWKAMRNKMTPFLSSGKNKAMLPLMLECNVEMIEFLRKNQGILEAKDITAKYTTNVIARCAFGINPKCFENECFRDRAKPFFSSSWRNAFSQTVYLLIPSLVNKLKLDFYEKATTDYFQTIFIDTMHSRSHTDRYNDLIDIMKDFYRDGDASVGTDISKSAGVAIQYFTAGFETTSSTISFTLLELCFNKEIQDQARQEIDDVIEKFGGITYEAIKEAKYLDFCISETLRKYPVSPFLARTCTRDYQIPDSDLVLDKGTAILIPAYGLQMDSTHYPDPQKYDPERFRNFSKDFGLTYVPFGDGPRSCIGERFARLIIKVAVMDILRTFELKECVNSPNPIHFDPKCFLLTPKTGLYIQFTEITHQI